MVTPTAANSDDARLVDRRGAVLFPAYRMFYREPLHVVRGAGTRLFDVHGDEYLDAYNNVPVIGHSHPRVTDAVAQQCATLNSHTRYLTDLLVDYSERILSTFGGPLHAIAYTCSGSESNDFALRIARRCSRGTGIIVTSNAYHGTTTATEAITPQFGGRLPLGQDVRVVPAPRNGDPDAGVKFRMHVRAAIDDLETQGFGVAALIVDTIMSSDGIVAEPSGFLQGAVAEVRAAGGIFIADEVQAGFGRTGSGFWGYMRHGLEPDVVTLGKPMGNGIPIGAVVTTRGLAEGYSEVSRYFNTFGGSSVSVAAAAAVLDVLAQDRLPEKAEVLGAMLQRELESLLSSSGVVAEVRGASTFIGIEIRGDERRASSVLADEIVNGYRSERVLVGLCGADAEVIKIRPPLVFTEADADRFLEATNAVFASFV